jgi:hypothetical protein
MRKILTAALLALLVSGCDKEVGRVSHPQQAYVEKGSHSCRKGPGYCYACGLGFNGKFKCDWGWKYSCPGSQPATYNVVPTTIKYESGKTTLWLDRSLKSIDGMCR